MTDEPKSSAKNKQTGTLCRAAEGIILGALAGIILWQFGTILVGGYIVAILATLGGILSLMRARIFLRAMASLLIIAYLLVAFVPITGYLSRGLNRRDELKSCPAVVVLGTAAFKDQTLSVDQQARLVTGYEILRQGYAPEMILTRPFPPATPWDQTARRQMQELKLDYPLEVVGPAHDTHDEAVEVAKLANDRGWQTVILVTHPWHMRRAAAAFEKAGLHVICAPCSEGRYDATNFNSPADRIAGFRNWLHEEVGFLVYRFRGWV